MKIDFYYNSQIGLMISWGTNFQQRKYITIEIPFLIIQIFLLNNKNTKTDK